MAAVQIVAMVEAAEAEAMVEAAEAHLAATAKCLKQRVLHAVKNAKFLLSQMAHDQYTAAIVLRRIHLKTQVEEWTETDHATDDVGLKIDKCLMQFAITVETNANFHLCHGKAKKYFVANALKKRVATQEKIMDSHLLKWKLSMQN